MFGWSKGGDGDRGGASCLSSPTWENNRTQHNSMDLPPDKRILHSAYCFVPPGNCNHLPKHDLTWTGRRDCAYAGVSQWGSINYARVRVCVCKSMRLNLDLVSGGNGQKRYCQSASTRKCLKLNLNTNFIMSGLIVYFIDILFVPPRERAYTHMFTDVVVRLCPPSPQSSALTLIRDFNELSMIFECKTSVR